MPAPRGSAPTTETGGTVSADPPLATMNTARNHSMGSTIAANEPAAKSSQSQARTFSATGFPPGVPGLDVSGWQVLNASDWARIAANGARFAYVKATESTDYTSSQFAEQYTDSFNAGLLHGAYHFATPNTSSGAAQANWFLDHGGQGTADGRTMPPLLDIEYNPYGATCYGLSPAAMVSWIYDFSQTVQARTGRQPAIYSTTSWWKLCTGNSAAFAANPLFIARYPNALSDGAGALPAGWSSYTLWQFASSGVFPGDQDVFNGSERDLQSFGLISSLVRTANNASVYLVSGANKYPVTNTSTLSAFSALGHVGYVPQSYLDQFATQHAAVPIIRGQDGSVYFADSGIRLPFASCGLVSDYGGSCDASGYVQLTATQTAAFALGPAATPLMTSAGGPLFYVTGGKKHEVLDKVSLAQAGLNGSANSLSATALSFLAFGTPIVRNNVYAMTAGSGTGVLLVGGSASPIDQSAASLIGLPQLAAGTLQPASVAQLPAGARFTGAFRSSADSSVTVISSNGLRPWAAGVGGASFTAVTAPTAAMSAYSVTQPIQAGNAIMSPAGGTVYLVMPNDIRPVGSWDSLVALAGGGTPNIAVVPQSIIASLPSGPVALDPATLVRSPGNATVYLVNGVTNKIPFSTFDQAIEAGFTKFSFTSDARLNAYPTSPDLLSFGLQCGSQRYVSAGGSIHALSSMTSSLYPLAFTPLDTFTCAIAPKGIDATAFIRTPDGSIYFLSEGKKRPITSLQRFVQLSQGQPYLNVVSAFAAAIPTGAPA
ncbi:lysozyme [Leifsonia xyli subsp. xyli str. CTCB07]|uniref:lysozyme n=1 Tax=Leifsonia xyli subsp. xyli (strain CTCB07) TaxID=281090 RepID=Q6AGL1_LEIXX|nr:lysozyme [Leifsonia xyli subsp. xyli str. CTCB07]